MFGANPAPIAQTVDVFARIDAWAAFYRGEAPPPPPLPAPAGFDEAIWARRRSGADERMELYREEIEAALARELLEREMEAA